MLEAVKIRPPGFVQSYNFAVDNRVGGKIMREQLIFEQGGLTHGRLLKVYFRCVVGQIVVLPAKTGHLI